MNKLKSLLAKISWKTYLFIGIIHFVCMPYIYKALLIMARKVPLSFDMNGILNSILYVIGTLFLINAYRTYINQEKQRQIKLVRKVMCWIGLIIYIPLVGTLLEFVLNLITFSKTGSFIANASYRVLWANLICEGVVFLFINRKKDGELEEQVKISQEDKVNNNIKSKKVVVLCVVALILGLTTGIVPKVVWENNTLPKNQLENKLAQARLLETLGQKESALQKYWEVEDYVNAIQGYLDGDNKTLLKLYDKNKDNVLFMDLYLKVNPHFELLELEFLHGVAHKEDCFQLLSMYKELESLSEQQLAMREECINTCVAKEYLYGNLKGFTDKQLDKDKLRELVEIYSIELQDVDVLELLVDISRSQEISEEMIERIFRMADAEKDNLQMQSIAVSYGSEYVFQTDSGRKKEQLVDIIFRFKELLEASTTGNEELALVKLRIAEMLGALDYDRHSLSLLEESYELFPMTDTAYLLMDCYNTYDDGEKIVEIVKNTENSGVEDGLLYFYGGIGNLLVDGKNVEESLKYGLKLVDLIENNKDEKKQENMEYFHHYIEYLKLNNRYINDLYGYCSVSEFSEDEQKIIDQSEFFNKYVTAFDCLYNQGDYENAVLNFKEADNLIPELASVQEMLGNTYYAMGDFENAIPYLEKAIGTRESITAAYALAQCYIQTERYEDALLQCEFILQTNGYDAYGIYGNTSKMHDELLSILEIDE